MPRFVLVQRASELVAELLADTATPAEKKVEAFFGRHRNMGPKDRSFAADVAYGVLRRQRSLASLLGEIDTPRPEHARDLVVAFLAVVKGVSARELISDGVGERVQQILQAARQNQGTQLPAAIRADAPDWLFDALTSQLGEAEALALCTALNQEAPADLRANTLKTNRQELQALLLSQGVGTDPTPYSPLGLRQTERAWLLDSPAFVQGLFEMQDEGSQIIGLLVEPRRHESVVDFCAGGGGKALQLAALMSNTGTVYAFDTAEMRLEPIKARLVRAGATMVRPGVIANEDDPRVRRLDEKIDRVLVDAPCTGTGTLRRHPDRKWKPVDLVSATRLQLSILRSAARLVKPGGRLVYATCSLLTQENEAVVSTFLQEHHDFAVSSVAPVLKRRHVTIADAVTAEGFLRLYPHRHATDGFFAAILARAPAVKER